MNIDQVVPDMTNFGSLVVAATGTSSNREPVDALLDRITEDDKLVDGLLDRILSSDQMMDRLFLKISSSINNTTSTEEGKAITSTDDVSGDGSKPTVEPMEAASDQQDGSACNGHCGEPSPIVTRFLSRLLENDKLLDELALRLAKLAKPVDRFITIAAAPGMEPMEQVYERGELTPPDDPSKQGQLGRFLQHLFLYEPAVLAFWYKLIDDDLFAESMLEPIYSNRYLSDLVSERLLDDDRMMEFN